MRFLKPQEEIPLDMIATKQGMYDGQVCDLGTMENHVLWKSNEVLSSACGIV